MQVDRRSDSRIVRSALDEVKAIQTLLADVYKDAGDGRTLVRELVQNADDARAEHLRFVVVDGGWTAARNGLLHGPALLVVNDGPFPARDRDAMHQALGGSKADEAGKIGRFGIGLKSVFHICEAIVYLGASAGMLRPGALNPWAGTGGDEKKTTDPIHPDWDEVDDDDLKRLLGVAEQLLGQFDDGLLQWIPLRRPAHLDRAEDQEYGLGQTLLSPDAVASWFQRSASLALLLAQCGSLRSIEAHRVRSPRHLRKRKRLARVVRPAVGRGGWVGRHEDDPTTPDRPFRGSIEDGAVGGRTGTWSVVGVEALGRESLRRIRSEPGWPSEPHWKNGRSVWVPRKALAHAAVAVLRTDQAPRPELGVRLRWAVFLPLDDDPVPRQSPAVEVGGDPSFKASWDIVLHGYFWPSHDRRSIPGVTDDDNGSGDGAARVRWNRALRDRLVLPLLPRALAEEMRSLPAALAWQLLGEVQSFRTVERHIDKITSRHVLLPAVTESGVSWEIRERAGVRVRSIPAWTHAPDAVRRSFAERWSPEDSGGTIFVDGNAPRLGGVPQEWTSESLDLVLGSVPVEAFRASRDLTWISDLLSHVLAPEVARGSQLAEQTARWIAVRIGEGALTPTVAGASSDEQTSLRSAWRAMFASLPEAWLVDAPVKSQPAVVELAREAVVGAGLLPLPLGHRPGESYGSQPEQQLVDEALRFLGARLAEEPGGSQRARYARLLLAETLLAVRGALPLVDDLSHLPLLRARRFPGDKDEAWSVGELRRQADRRRVFARPRADTEEDPALLPSSPTDPRRAVEELAEALGESIWFVDAAVAERAGVPPPTKDALARAVLRFDAVTTEPSKRRALLKRLGTHDADGLALRALRVLLTGGREEAGGSSELYCVQDSGKEGQARRTTLRLLLGLLRRTSQEVEPTLVGELPFTLVQQRLGLRNANPALLHALLGEAIQAHVDWERLEEAQILHLLEQLSGNDESTTRLWRSMPLHRDIGGRRGPFDSRALRAVGSLRLPPGLESEIRLLDPDPKVCDSYRDVPVLDDDGVLHAMLVCAHPWRYADRIVDALRDDTDRRVVLPRSPELRGLLEHKPWLPCVGGEAGVAPNRILMLPPEVQGHADDLALVHGLGEYRVPAEVHHEVWSAAKDVVHEVLRRPNPARQLQQLAQALDGQRLAELGAAGHIILPESSSVDVGLVHNVLQSPLPGSHEGWGLVRASANAVLGAGKPLTEAPAAARNAVLAMAHSLCGPVSTGRQSEMLQATAAARPPKDSPAGRAFRQLIERFAATRGFFKTVLPRIELPTQDGRWHPAREVARSASGVARRHRVLTELRDALRLDSNEPVEDDTASDRRIGAGSADALTKYFRPWADRVPAGAVGAFLGLLGNGKDGSIARLAERWLGEDNTVEGLRRQMLQGARSNPFDDLKVFVSGSVARGKSVKALNVLGKRVKMAAGSDDDSVFATDPELGYSVLGDFWKLRFRDVEPRRRTQHDLVRLLGGAVQWWATKVLRLEHRTVRAWWSRWGTGSQAQVGPVQASILAHLPLTLRQLDVRDSEPLREALRDAERCQRRREQAPAGKLQQAMELERGALAKLAGLIEDDAGHQHFLWQRVQTLMQRFGYRADSVLLELAQNADDALAQAAEIAGGPLPPAARRLIVRVHRPDGLPTVDVIHYGRPINETGGAAFPAGRNREWGQDLYFMMLLNLSGKPGEGPGQHETSSTTGRFGLGFKSVHLVSSCPSVVSGYLAFSIAGGLLPLEQPVPKDPDLQAEAKQRATRVRLPLREDQAPAGLLERMFSRFAYARSLLPAFARQLREVLVDGGPAPGVTRFDGASVPGAPGWSVDVDATELPGGGRWLLVRYRPADEGLATGTVSLLFGVQGDVAKPFPADLPFLWNVAPTSESWGCGYAVNGPFKLDPGRTHVSLDDEATLRVFNELGEALGKGLVALYDALAAQEGDVHCGLPAGSRLPTFAASLWKVLASGMGSPDELRRRLLLGLHSEGCGISAWMNERSVVPSGLPHPFASVLPPFKRDLRIEAANPALEDRKVCKAFAKIDSIASLMASRCVVSTEIAGILRALLTRTRLRPLAPSDVLEQLLETWDHILLAEQLHALRPLADDAVWKLITGGVRTLPSFSRLLGRAADGRTGALRSLLLPPNLRLADPGVEVADELMRSSFAPLSRTLHPAYVETSEDLAMFQRLRVSHNVDAETIAGWYAQLPAERQPAALRYLLLGRLQQEVLACLVLRDRRPAWLEEFESVSGMLDDLDVEDWRRRQLLAVLFPERFHDDSEPEDAPLLAEPRKRTFFQRLQDWWGSAGVRREVLDHYEEHAWPEWLLREGLAEGLRADSCDHWLALLVLGACRSLGRAKPGHPRVFLEDAKALGWWEVFKAPDKLPPWMKLLRDWQDSALAGLRHARWMSLFPAIHQLSRYLETYRRLLRGAGRRPAALLRVACLLAPRVDEALTGAGQQFDAPPAPLNMGVHWVLRELVRLRILDGDHLLPSCWVPSEQVLRFLSPLGLRLPDAGTSNEEKARAVSSFLAAELGKPNPHLHRSFDIPLRHVATDAALRQQLGLED